MTIDLRNWLRADDGSPISGATVEAFVSGTEGFPTTDVSATTSTEATTGRWAVEGLDAGYLYDLKFTSGSQVRWHKGGASPEFFRVTCFDRLRLGDGSVGSPGLQFLNDPDTGIYRIGANNIGIAVNGVKQIDIGTVAVAFTPVVRAPNGAVGAPAFGFVNDATSGLYYVGAGNIGLAISGAKVLDVNATGLGIGIAPTAPLHAFQTTPGSAVQKLQSNTANDNAIETVYQNRVATTDATVTTIHTIAIPANTTVGIEARVVARRTGGSAGTADDGAFYRYTTMAHNPSGTAVIIGPKEEYISENQAGWEVGTTASGGNVLIQVTGAANNSITWHLTLRVWQVSS